MNEKARAQAVVQNLLHLCPDTPQIFNVGVQEIRQSIRLKLQRWPF